MWPRHRNEDIAPEQVTGDVYWLLLSRMRTHIDPDIPT